MANPAVNEDQEPLLLSIKKAAEILGISAWQVRQHVPITKIGNRSYVAAKVLREFGDKAAS
jgi:hypothetical protein